MEAKIIHLHIGGYKTGSTSLQCFLWDHGEYLRAHELTFYEGFHIPSNHIELYLASMRYSRDSLWKVSQSRDPEIGSAYTARVRNRIHDFFQRVETDSVILTTEGLSLLRHQDEIERLRDILSAEDHRIRVMIYLRNKEDFLKSYARQIAKVKGRRASSSVDSSLYVGSDSWLVDYDSLVGTFRRGFGDDAVQVLDYDALVARDGCVIPSFLDQVGLPLPSGVDLEAYRMNRTSPPRMGGKPERTLGERWRARFRRLMKPR